MKIQIAYAAMGIAICACLAYFNYSTPQCVLARGTESAMTVFAVLLFFVIMLPLIVLGGINRRKDKKHAAFIFVVFIVIGPTVLLGIQRGSTTQRNYWEFDGVVSGKFISRNHSSKSLVVAGKEYEFIPAEIWNAADVGSDIKKEVCSNIFLNSREFKFPP